MEILVEKLDPSVGGRVFFSCEFGSGWAFWDPASLPRKGVFNVEFDCMGASVERIIISREKDFPHEIYMKDFDVVIRGLIENISEDGVVVIKFGSDIIFVDIEENLDNLNRWQIVEIKIEKLKIYPYSI